MKKTRCKLASKNKSKTTIKQLRRQSREPKGAKSARREFSVWVLLNFAILAVSAGQRDCLSVNHMSEYFATLRRRRQTTPKETGENWRSLFIRCCHDNNWERKRNERRTVALQSFLFTTTNYCRGGHGINRGKTTNVRWLRRQRRRLVTDFERQGFGTTITGDGGPTFTPPSNPDCAGERGNTGMHLIPHSRTNPKKERCMVLWYGMVPVPFALAGSRNRPKLQSRWDLGIHGRHKPGPTCGAATSRLDGWKPVLGKDGRLPEASGMAEVL
eukprot:scaffold34916_cov170-Amphora_coffeaeformis.AAC.2